MARWALTPPREMPILSAISWETTHSPRAVRRSASISVSLEQSLTIAPSTLQKLFKRFVKWNAKLDPKKVLVKPSPQLELAFATGDG